jgi:hypothetical protein
MKLRFLAIFALFGLMATGAFAHGDKKHVSGVVEKINADSVIVKSPDAKSVEVKLVASTIYTLRINLADKPAKLTDLAVGDHVVIHATPKGDTLEAAEVKFSHAAPAASSSAATGKPKS